MLKRNRKSYTIKRTILFISLFDFGGTHKTNVNELLEITKTEIEKLNSVRARERITIGGDENDKFNL
jgi:hypothetical protein